MRILVDILHPKQAHFFRPLIGRWRAAGHVVLIVTRDKDITHLLLDRFGFSYTCLSRQKKGLGLAYELLERWVGMFVVMRRFRPDVAISMAGLSTSLPARVLGISNIAFTDTETATLQNFIGLTFADRILTPSWYCADHGPRHYRYNGFHEWSYLNPDDFQPDPEIVRKEGIDPAQPYVLVRFVGWQAAHDWRQAGFSVADMQDLIYGLGRKYRVVVSSEVDLPDEFAPYTSRVNVENMHHVLAHAAFMVGESPTMACEAAVLGVPALLASSWAGDCGNMKVLAEKYGMLQVFPSGKDAVAAALDMAANEMSRERIMEKHAGLIGDLEPMAAVFAGHIEALTGEKV